MKLGKIRILLILSMLLIYTGCKVDIIDAGKRIPLVKGSSQSGEWKAFEYIMHYTYLYTQPENDTPGSIELSGFLRKSGGGLDSLTIWVYLLDGNGRVLERKSIYDSGHKARHMGRSFTVTLDVPPETAGISFTHMAAESRGHQ